MNSLPTNRNSLWVLTIAPTIWALHFLLSYLTAAIWCAKYGKDLGVVRIAIAVYTAVGLVAISITAWQGLRWHTHGSTTLPHDANNPEDRQRFLGFASLLLSALSAVAILYVASVAYFIETCD